MMRKESVMGGLALAVALASTVAFAAAASFESKDANGDGKLTKDEFYGTVADAGTYSDWDTNSDGLLDEDEFTEIGYDWDWGTFDADGNDYVDADELYDGIYESYDVDNDGYWNNTEFDDADDEGWFDV